MPLPPPAAAVDLFHRSQFYQSGKEAANWRGFAAAAEPLACGCQIKKRVDLGGLLFHEEDGLGALHLQS